MPNPVQNGAMLRRNRVGQKLGIVACDAFSWFHSSVTRRAEDSSRFNRTQSKTDTCVRMLSACVFLALQGVLSAMKELPHTRSCFVCGEFNPSGLKLRFNTDGKVVLTRFVPGAEHVGFHHTVHGGIIATLLDEVMVWACAVVTRRFAFCAELNVRFTHPVRPLEEVFATGELVSNRRGKLFEARAELRDGTGKVLATATGKYLPIKEPELGPLAADFMGDTGWLLGRPT